MGTFINETGQKADRAPVREVGTTTHPRHGITYVTYEVDVRISNGIGHVEDRHLLDYLNRGDTAIRA